MKSKLLYLTFFLISNMVYGQHVPKEKRLITPVTVDSNFADTLSFTQQWDYPWYILVDNNGSFESLMGDTIRASDTLRLYYTANCETDHQGEHTIKYCNGNIVNDTITLFFLPQLPAYASSLSITIYQNSFWSNFEAVYPQTVMGEKLVWTIDTQKLIIDKASYHVGDSIKGYVEVNFTETSLIKHQKPFSRHFYYKGFFKTSIKNDKIMAL